MMHVFEMANGKEIEVEVEYTVVPFRAATMIDPAEGGYCEIDNDHEIQTLIGRELSQEEIDDLQEQAAEHEMLSDQAAEDAYWDSKLHEARENGNF